jgi:hypothetical protein
MQVTDMFVTRQYTTADIGPNSTVRTHSYRLEEHLPAPRAAAQGRARCALAASCSERLAMRAR